MSLEQLQDYAVQLENDLTTQKELVTTKDNELNEMRTLNTTLQKRNNDLFRQVEQQVPGQSDSQEGEPEPTVSCEDLARKNYKEFIK